MSETVVGYEFIDPPLALVAALMVAGLAAVAFVVGRNRKRT